MNVLARNMPLTVAKGKVYCYMCTHTVEADVVTRGRHRTVKPGQKCPRCSAPLDSGYVLQTAQAA
jgi:hypothetical protein